MNNRWSFFTIWFSAFLLFSCRKACTHDYLPDSIKPFLFKEGSWWIYDNSITGSRDTFRVIKVTAEVMQGLVPMACRGTQLDEVYDMTIVNRTDTFKMIAFGEPCLLVSGKAPGPSGLVFDASLTSGECAKYDTSLCCRGVAPLTAGNHNFSEAIQMKSIFTDGSGMELATCDLYWVKNVGLVKLVRHDSQASSLSLVEWNVVQ